MKPSLCARRLVSPLVGARTRLLLSRKGHGGRQQTRRELERMVLLEHAQTPPSQRRAGFGRSDDNSDKANFLNNRGSEAPPRRPSGFVSPHHWSALGSASQALAAESAAFLRTVDRRVATARQELFGPSLDAPPSSSEILPGDSHQQQQQQQQQPTVTSLRTFITECKRLRVDIGLERRQREREALRRQLRFFWRQNADSAVTCCAMWGRDFGFVAGHGLSDDGLHMAPFALKAALATVLVTTEVSSCIDVMLSLDYITRELVYWEKQQSRGGSSPWQGGDRSADAAAASSDSLPTREELVDLRHTVTDAALERIAFFYLLHVPPSGLSVGGGAGGGGGGNSNSGDGASGVSEVSRGSGTGADVLSALEVLSRVTVNDASHALIRRLRSEAVALPRSAAAPPSPPHSTPPPPPPAVDKAALVTRLFLLLMTQRRRHLNFTALVQSFALLRIFLPLLWPPYAHADRSGRGAAGSPSQLGQQQHSRQQQKPSLSKEREALQRITWGLAVALKAKDTSFINPYHFVKITASLARLPAFTLAPYGSGSSSSRSGSSSTSTGHGSDVRRLSPRDAEYQRELQRLGVGADGGALPPTVKREMRSLRDLPVSELFGDGSGGGGAAHNPAAERSTFRSSGGDGTVAQQPPALSAPDFWRYMVAKACVFVPSLPLPQRRTAVSGLNTAVAVKRGPLLLRAEEERAAAALRNSASLGHRPSSSVTSSSPPASTSPWAGGGGRSDAGGLPGLEELGDCAEDILLPLVEEMAALEEGFDESITQAKAGKNRWASGGGRENIKPASSPPKRYRPGGHSKGGNPGGSHRRNQNRRY